MSDTPTTGTDGGQDGPPALFTDGKGQAPTQDDPALTDRSGRPGGDTTARLQALETTISGLTSQLSEIAEARNNAADTRKSARDEADSLQSQFDAMKAELDSTRREALATAADARNPKAVAKLIADAPDQELALQHLRETDPYLFKAASTPGSDPAGGQSTDQFGGPAGGGLADMDAALRKMVGRQ